MNKRSNRKLDKKKNKKKKSIIIISILVIIAICLVCAYNMINRIQTKKLNVTDEELNISKETSEKSKKHNVKNILLLGVDEQENASDTIMILSLDEDDKSAKLTSIMRDTYVYFGEGKANKINYAYHYGGPELTIKTINDLFNLDIGKYVKVDFDGLESVIDYLGGVEVTINEAERGSLNARKPEPLVNNIGKVSLNGSQALAYSRIRKIDSDFERTQRQRNVMFSVFNKAKDISFTSYPKMISDLSSNIETNMGTFELLDIAKYLVNLNINEVDDFRIPLDGTTEHNSEGVYHLEWDKEVNTKAIHDFIYGE